METILCAAVGTASHQHGLEACTVCMVDLELCWQMTKLYRTYMNLISWEGGLRLIHACTVSNNAEATESHPMVGGSDSTLSFPFSYYCYNSLQPPLQQLKALVTPVKVITWSSLPMLYEQHLEGSTERTGKYAGQGCIPASDVREEVR